MTKACSCCGKEFEPRNSQQKSCGSVECKNAYRQTAEYRAYMRAYQRAYRQTAEHKAYKRAYQRAYSQAAERKVYERARKQTAKRKAYEQAYKQTYRNAEKAAKALGMPMLFYAAMKALDHLQESNSVPIHHAG